MSVKRFLSGVQARASGSDDLRPLGHLAEDLRAAVSITSEHAACLLLDGPGQRLESERRRSVEAIQRQVARLERLIDELDSRGGSTLAMHPTPPPPAIEARPPLARLLLADDDPDCLESLENLFEGRYEVTMTRNGREALERLRSEEFDLAILDQDMPGQSGLEVAELLATQGRTPPAFMFLSGQPSAEVRARGLSLGAADFVTKPVDPDELLARVARTISAVRRERSLVADAFSDPLTGLPNYRSLARNLELELERARRYNLPLALLTIDLDNLKGINDALGHGAGNDAIRLVASAVEGAVRKFETVARQGGDELSILLPDTTEAQALALGERLRIEVAGRSVRGRALSISVGVASRERDDNTASARSLVDASDQALYRSKRAGRNRVSGRL